MESDKWTRVPAAYPRDWAEDVAHENGNYWNECGTCRRMFIGHKRRVTCRECASTAPEPLPAPAPESKEDQ